MKHPSWISRIFHVDQVVLQSFISPFLEYFTPFTQYFASTYHYRHPSIFLYVPFFCWKKFWKTVPETPYTWAHNLQYATTFVSIRFHSRSWLECEGVGTPPAPLTLANAIPPSIIFRFLNFVTYTYHIFYFGYPISLEWIMNCFVGRLLHRFLKIRFQQRKRIPQLLRQKRKKGEKLLRAPNTCIYHIYIGALWMYIIRKKLAFCSYFFISFYFSRRKKYFSSPVNLEREKWCQRFQKIVIQGCCVRLFFFIRLFQFPSTIWSMSRMSSWRRFATKIYSFLLEYKYYEIQIEYLYFHASVSFGFCCGKEGEAIGEFITLFLLRHQSCKS